MGGVSTGAFIRGVSGVPDSGLLFQSAIPFILAGGTATNQFTVNSTGLVTALPTLPFTSGFAFVYIPSGVTGTAGWYYAQVQSATSVQLYTARYTSGDPRLAVPTVLVVQSTTAGNYSQLLTQIVAHQYTLPGGSMGPNGSIRHTTLAAHAATGTQNVYAGNFGALNLFSNGLVVTANGIVGISQSIFNMNATNRQIVNSFTSDTAGNNSVAPGYGSVNTSADVTFDIRLTIGAAINYVIVSALRVELFYGA